MLSPPQPEVEELLKKYKDKLSKELNYSPEAIIMPS